MIAIVVYSGQVATMSTDASKPVIMIEPSTVTELERSLVTEFLKAELADVKVHAFANKTVRIDTPVEQLVEYRFALTPLRCSWTASKATIILKLAAFAVEQRAEDGLLCVELREHTSMQSLLLGLGGEAPSRVREIFLTRSLRALQGLKSLDEENLAQAVQAPTDYSVLVAALSADEALVPIRADDPLAAARLRGLDAKRKLLQSEGGTLSSAEGAQVLKITRQAVDKRRQDGTLLAVELGKKGYQYPSWQFGLEGLEEVLAELSGRDFWEQVSFFLNPSALLHDRPPLDVLREGKKNLTDVVIAAKNYGEHGG